MAEVFEWESNSKLKSTDLRQTSDIAAPSPPCRVMNAFTFAQNRILLVETSPLYEERSTSESMVFNLLPPDSDRLLLRPITGFNELSKGIKHIIGGYGSSLLFMDASRWVCSLDINQGNWKSYVQHFPIPFDWRSQQRRLLMAVTRSGAVLFVRTNEVAVIFRGLDFEERIQVKSD